MREIPLTRGKVALIDDDDWETVRGYRWIAGASKKTMFHARANFQIDGKQHYVLMHRLLMGAQKGDIVDHINGDELDNRRSNMRLATEVQNRQNRAMGKNNALGVRNVYAVKGGRYRAEVSGNGLRRQKRFDCIEAASAWAAEMRAKLHDEFAYQPERDARLPKTVDRAPAMSDT